MAPGIVDGLEVIDVQIQRAQRFSMVLGALHRKAAQLEEALADVLRPDDLFGRLGGDEFAVLLPGCGLTNALAVVERLKAAVSASATPVGPLTISVGAAPLRPGQDLAKLLADADIGLMEAKRQGRNRVCVAPDAQHVPFDT